MNKLDNVKMDYFVCFIFFTEMFNQVQLAIVNTTRWVQHFKLTFNPQKHWLNQMYSNPQKYKVFWINKWT